jgi:hypothetical protein
MHCRGTVLKHPEPPCPFGGCFKDGLTERDRRCANAQCGRFPKATKQEKEHKNDESVPLTTTYKPTVVFSGESQPARV